MSGAPAARTPPRVPRTGVPVSLLVDYDGTISRLDIGDELLARHVSDKAEIVRQDAAYDAGDIGSRELMRWDMDVLPHRPALLRAEAQAMAQDEAFPDFVAVARRHGAAVEVVSDGLGFYVQPNLARLGLVDVPVAANRNRVSGAGQALSFPYGHPACFVCGTCKRQRVWAHQALGRIVVYIGDGTSDRYAAYHADLVVAKGPLARFCLTAGWPFRPWTDFAELTAWLGPALTDGSLPRRPAEVAPWRVHHPPAAGRGGSAFICGPEAWGPGRERPEALPPGRSAGASARP